MRLLVAITALVLSGSVLAQQLPANAHVNPLGQWQCDRGYRRNGQRCESVSVPQNAHVNVFGNDWECDRGYRRAGAGCAQVLIPANAHIDVFGNDWECNRGYRRNSQGCVQVAVPANAHVDVFGNDWECNRGYRRDSQGCVQVAVPANAHIDVFGSDWDCDSGFQRAGNACRRMTADEVAQQQARELALLAALQQRGSGSISGDDCDFEYETESEVCVSVSDAELECQEAFDGDYYRGCDANVEYSVSTNYSGDDYLDVGVECTVEIGYRGRNSFSSSDSSTDDENHSLYEYGSEDGDLSFEFSFSPFSEVTSVRIDSVECEIDDVYHY